MRVENINRGKKDEPNAIQQIVNEGKLKSRKKKSIELPASDMNSGQPPTPNQSGRASDGWTREWGDGSYEI